MTSENWTKEDAVNRQLYRIGDRSDAAKLAHSKYKRIYKSGVRLGYYWWANFDNDWTGDDKILYNQYCKGIRTVETKAANAKYNRLSRKRAKLRKLGSDTNAT